MKSLPWIKQSDSMQCGAACLTMICRFHGMNKTLSDISLICRPTKSGISIKGIEDSARELGFSGNSYYLSTTDLKTLKNPVILHWNQNHFVVLYKINKNGQEYVIADPSRGIITLSLEEFRKQWISSTIDEEELGVAIILNLNLPLQPFEVSESVGYEDNPIERSSFNYLLKYIKDYKKFFVHIIMGLVLGCILQLILPFLTQWIVDKGIRHADLRLIWLILLGELMIVIGRTATDFVRRWMLLHVSLRINISLVSDFFIKLLKLPMSFFDTKLTGDLLQRIEDHSRVQNFLTGKMLNIFFTMITFIVFGIVLCIYSPLIFAVFIIGSLVYGSWIAMFLSRRKVLDYELFGEQAKNQNRTYQFITSMQEIKLQDCERRRRWEWEDTQADLFVVQMKSMKLQQIQEAGSIFINEVKNIIITVFAATAVIDGHITLGSMLAIQYIVGQLNSPVEQLMQFIYSYQDVKISLERISEIHKGKDEESNVTHAKEFMGEKSICLMDVDFKYDLHVQENTLEDISFVIPHGKVTAIVGASGSGKTTLIKLILGYYKVTKGTIGVAGRDLNEYNLKWWRRHCGVVMQDGVIFSESIARNIAVSDGDVDLEHLEQAARIANIHEYVMSLPLKYNTLIGPDGVGLSQGQKQRILIARAVYKNPDFIFLDEATNALDAKNEKAIVENLNDFYKGKTVVVVAHRLSTVKNADNIIVLDNGKVIEVGDHASLIEKRGLYYNLVKNQLELGK